MRAFATEAGFLHAAEWSNLGRDDAFVYAHDAVFERFTDAPDAADVPRVEVRGEAELSVVGELDGFLLGLGMVQLRDRSECLFASVLHLCRHVCDHRRLEEIAA